MRFIPLPGYFTDYLRRETGVPTFELVWLPDEPRLVRRFRFGPWDKGTGCYGVCMWTRQRMDQDTEDGRIIHSEWIPYITPLNGNHDMPLTPGRWVIDMFADSDKCRKGDLRSEEVDAWRRAKLEKEINDRDAFARERARDPLLYETSRRYAEELGTETPSREEMIAYEKDVAEQTEDLYKRDSRALKDASYYAGVDREDLF